jgi:hypothetical protein
VYGSGRRQRRPRAQTTGARRLPFHIPRDGRSTARPLRGGGPVLRPHARRRLRRDLPERLAVARH